MSIIYLELLKLCTLNMDHSNMELDYKKYQSSNLPFAWEEAGEGRHYQMYNYYFLLCHHGTVPHSLLMHTSEEQGGADIQRVFVLTSDSGLCIEYELNIPQVL